MVTQPNNYTNLYTNCFSSCVGTLIAEIATLPACTIKTIYQNNKSLTIPETIRSIIKTQGTRGFFTASSPAIITQVLSTSSKFTLYEKIKHIRKTENSNWIDNSINGVVSGLTGSLITHPFDVWKNFPSETKTIGLILKTSHVNLLVNLLN